MSLPRFVTERNMKGTVAYMSGGKYYIYKSKSVRKPGVKYPVAIRGECLGYFDHDGVFHKPCRTMISSDDIPVVREFAFTKYMIKNYDSFRLDLPTTLSSEEWKTVFETIVLNFSRNSYLKDFFEDPPLSLEELSKKYRINASIQCKKLMDYLKQDFFKLETLKSICIVRFRKKVYLSKLTKYEKDLMDELEIGGYEQSDLKPL